MADQIEKITDKVMELCGVYHGDKERRIPLEQLLRALTKAVIADTIEAQAYAEMAAEDRVAVKRHIRARDSAIVQLDEGQRQATLMALAKLSVERPGWQWMLEEIAKLMDDKRPDGRPQLFTDFRALRTDPLQELLKGAPEPENEMQRLDREEEIASYGKQESENQPTSQSGQGGSGEPGPSATGERVCLSEV
jgi:hypothetical protein